MSLYSDSLDALSRTLGNPRSEFSTQNISSQDSQLHKAALIEFFHEQFVSLYMAANIIAEFKNPVTAVSKWRSDLLSQIFTNPVQGESDYFRVIDGITLFSKPSRGNTSHTDAVQVFERQIISQVLSCMRHGGYERLLYTIDTDFPQLDARSTETFSTSIKVFALENLAITSGSTGNPAMLLSALSEHDTTIRAVALEGLAGLGYSLGKALLGQHNRDFIEHFRLHGLITGTEEFVRLLQGRFTELQPIVMAALHEFHICTTRDFLAARLDTNELKDYLYCDCLGSPLEFFSQLESAGETGNFLLWKLARDLPNLRHDVVRDYSERIRMHLTGAYQHWFKRTLMAGSDCIDLLHDSP